ncbi:hypothetical protein BMI90_11830 [Thioclava sp. L04-15]|nr:hypothetical protein BMI90_11830 [Thioclava sp. L04-15]TNE90791.1 MAG: hypothetical protein EP337_07265 [Paracoccaceae bacterium]
MEGDEVRVSSGPFVDFIATIDSIDPVRRLWLLINIIGAASRVSVPDRRCVRKEGNRRGRLQANPLLSFGRGCSNRSILGRTS